MQYSTTLRNNQLDQIQTTGGATAHLIMYSGAMPANCAAAATGTVIATMALPSTFMAAAGTPTAGQVTKSGTWTDASADALGTLGYFRIYTSAGATVCVVQGTITLAGGGGDMIVDNTSVTAGQSITVSTFTVGAGNA